MRKAKCSFFSDFVEMNSDNQGKLFRAIKSLLKRKDKITFPRHDEVVLVNELGKHFAKKILDIHSEIDNGTSLADNDDGGFQCDDYIEYSVNIRSFEAFEPLSENDVYNLIMNSKKKSSYLDPVPTDLLMKCLDVLLPMITKIINISLETGCFPNDWKEAIILVPILKKAGLESSFDNLRPTSYLAYISKLIERAVYNQIHDHLLCWNLYPILLSAYQQYHSTETALLKVLNDILMNVNSQRVTLLVLLDLSSAFDTIDHKILLERLSSKFGFRGKVLSWFSSYLSGRSYRVMLNGKSSDKYELNFGIPQGSCLGPLLFILYASKFFDIVGNHVPDSHCFADDSQLYVSLKPDDHDLCGQSEAILAMENCISDLRKWMLKDKLIKLNDGETEFLMIGSKQQLQKLSPRHVSAGSVDIFPVQKVCNLGVWYDSHLSMSTHIAKTYGAAFYWLYNIKRISKFLSKENLISVIHAFVTSRLDYCNSILYSLPSSELIKLQRVQNAAARLVTSTPRYCHITPILYELHWLPVKFRINFKLLLITFKALYGMAPNYISDLLNIKKKGNYSLRSNDSIMLEYP